MEEQEEYGKSFNIQIWKRLLPFFKPYKKQFAITFLLNIVLAAVDVVVPLFQSEAIDRFIIPDTLAGIGRFAALYVLVIVVQTVCVYVSVHAAIIIDMNVGKDLKWAQFKHLQLLSFSYYNRTPVGYIHARVMSDTLRISTLTAWSLVDLFWALLYVITIFIIMFVLNARLAVIILLIVPCLAGLTAFFQNRILHWNRKARHQNAKITNAYNEELTGIRTTKSMVLEQDNYEAFTNLSSQMKRFVLRGTKLNAIYVPLILFFSSVTAAFVLTRGGVYGKRGADETRNTLRIPVVQRNFI